MPLNRGPMDRPSSPAAARRAAALLALSAWTSAHATNGYFAHGYSVAQQALGGAGTAYASDALAVSINPAGIALVGNRFDLNVGGFQPERWYRAGARGAGAGPGIFTVDPGTVHSSHERFMIPAMAYSHVLGPSSSWGLALYGNGGMNTDYRDHAAMFAQGLTGFETHCQGTFGGGPPVAGAADNAGLCGNAKATAMVDLIQLFVVPSYARRLGAGSAVGIAPIFAGQRFTATGLSAFARFSNAPDKVSDNGYDYAFGVGGRLGVTLALSPVLMLAGSYQSRIDMTPFDKYAGLFAAQGDFDIPSNWNAGVQLRLPHRQRLLWDYQHVDFHQVRAVGNPLDPNRFINDCALPRLGGSTAQSPACLGADTGPGFGWRAVTTHKYGYEVAFGGLRLRLGYSKNQQPIPQGEVLFNILAPGVPEEHYTGGFSYRVARRWDADLALTYARNHPVTGKNPLSNSTATAPQLLSAIAMPGSGNTRDAFGSDPNDQDVTLEMRQYIVTLGLSYRF